MHIVLMYFVFSRLTLTPMPMRQTTNFSNLDNDFKIAKIVAFWFRIKRAQYPILSQYGDDCYY